MKIITILNQKGGVGKTTTTKELGIGLARIGKKVLFIDLDPQKNLSNRFQLGEVSKNILTILKGETSIEETIVNITPNIDIIPGTNTLSLLRFFSIPSKESILQRRLSKEKDFFLNKNYNYIFIDVNADFGDYTFNALAVTDKVYVPIQVEGMALEGVEVLQSGLDLAKDIGHFTIEGYFCTMLDGRIKKHKENAEEVKNYFKEKAFNTIIRRNSDIDKANTEYKSIFDFNGSTGFEDYLNFIVEFLEREENYIKNISELRKKLMKGEM